SRDEIEQMLASHRLYLETEYRQGHRANLASADLAGAYLDGAQFLNCAQLIVTRNWQSAFAMRRSVVVRLSLTGCLKNRCISLLDADNTCRTTGRLSCQAAPAAAAPIARRGYTPRRAVAAAELVVPGSSG